MSTITGGIGLVAARRAGRRPRPAAVGRPAPPAGRRAAGRRTGRLGGTGAPAALRDRASLALVAGPACVGAVVPTLAEGSLATGLGGGTGGGTGTALDPVAAAAGPAHPARADRPAAAGRPSVADPGYLRAVVAGPVRRRGRLDDEQPRRRDARSPTTTGSRRCPPAQAGRAVERDDHGARARRPVPAGAVSPRSRCACWTTTRRLALRPGHRAPSSAATSPPAAELLAWRPPSRGPSPALLAEPRPLAAGDDRAGSGSPSLPRAGPRGDRPRGRELTAGAGRPRTSGCGAIHDYLTDRANGFIYSLVHRAGHQRRRPGRLPPAEAGLLRAVRRRDGGHGAGGRACRPGWRWATRRAASRTTARRLITSDDAHAWVEVYFDDLGWVPFDPTPIAVDRAVELPWAPRAGRTRARTRRRTAGTRAHRRPGADPAARTAPARPSRRPVRRAPAAARWRAAAGRRRRRAAGRRRARARRPASASLQRRRRLADGHAPGRSGTS